METATLMAAVGRSATSAGAKRLLSNYRPSGVPRTGSPEDRGGAYRAFLDAASRLASASLRVHFMMYEKDEPGSDEVRRTADSMLLDLHVRLQAAQDDFSSALLGIELCGVSYVIEAAGNLAEEIGKLPQAGGKGKNAIEGYDHAAYEEAVEVARGARGKFLEAARHDLAYNPSWWQFARRYKERQFRKRTEAPR
ncbi:hypothetical protein [Streptomyces sp. NPDC056480]|uniref:hypothetical protein n=1 Tax=Streptomyces sp. NPDC056480 TaxID=3345833 RepID=UPI003697C1E8